MVVVPNQKIATSIITNYALPETECSMLVAVGVSYDSDLDHVEKITVAVAKEVLRDTDGAVKDFDPFIRYNAFGESSIQFNVILRIKNVVDQHLIRHEFIKRLHMRYRDEGIKIPFPTRTIKFCNQLYLTEEGSHEIQNLGRTGIWVSELCFGTMSFGNEADETEAAKMFGKCREAGVNFFDCSNNYSDGRSEEILGNLISDCRDEVVITSKVSQRIARISMQEEPRAATSSLRSNKPETIENRSHRHLFHHHFDPFTPRMNAQGTG